MCLKSAMRCSTNDQFVDSLVRAGLCKNKRVESALRSVDRSKFVRDPETAYLDRPQSIGHGVTISAPHMHVVCLEILEPFLEPGMRALDCGSGSGYLTAAMMAMVSEGGSPGGAFGIECVEALVPWSMQNVANDNKIQWLEDTENFDLVHGDGSKGFANRAPFNSIHVGAAAPHIPKPLIDQLASPGRLVIPVGPQHGAQELIIVDKASDSSITKRRAMDVRYVPFHMKGTEVYE